MNNHQRLVGNDDCSEFHSPATVYPSCSITSGTMRTSTAA
jgi:hypothetical protein